MVEPYRPTESAKGDLGIVHVWARDSSVRYCDPEVDRRIRDDILALHRWHDYQADVHVRPEPVNPAITIGNPYPSFRCGWVGLRVRAEIVLIHDGPIIRVERAQEA